MRTPTTAPTPSPIAAGITAAAVAPTVEKKSETAFGASYTASRLHARFTASPRPKRPSRVAKTIAAAPKSVQVELQHLKNRGVLGALNASVQTALVTAMSRLCEDAAAVEVLRGTVTSTAFAALASPEQLELLAYADGPRASRHAVRGRQAELDRTWAPCRQALAEAVADADLLGLGAQSLRSFLADPTQELWIYESTHYRWHAVVVLGDPDEAASLAYGQRWHLHGGSAVRPRVHSPDRRWSTGWMEPGTEATLAYTHKCTMLSRREELKLVSWLENNFVINEDPASRARRLGPVRIHDNAYSFAEEVLHTLVAVTAARGAPEFFAGVSVHPSAR